MKALKFTKIALKDYKHVGALVPSSKFVAKKIAGKVEKKKFIVEYGAGDGVITKEILKKISLNSELIAFELNKDLFAKLEKIGDNRLKSINDDVERAASYLNKKAEVIISGIPFSLLDRKKREEIIEKTSYLLEPGGIFILYQTSPLVRPILKRYFRRVRMRLEPRNLPPYFILVAEK